MIRVLFVCLGNICRSPMAEGVFQHMVDEAGLGDDILADSAGTGSWHVDEPAHSGTRQVLEQNGIAYNGRSRKFARQDFDNFDYILAMDRSNERDMRALLRGDEKDAEIRMFMSFAPETGVEDVPDPYYRGRFDFVYELVDKAAAGLLAYIREQHDL